MRSNSRILPVTRLAAVSAACAALAFAGPSTAYAADPSPALAPSVTVSPSTGLTNGQNVTATVAGFPSTQVAVGVCTLVDGAPVCDPNSKVQFATDSAGRGSAVFAVHKSFTGYTVADDGTFKKWGVVDCAAMGCMVGATDGQVVVTANISFR